LCCCCVSTISYFAFARRETVKEAILKAILVAVEQDIIYNIMPNILSAIRGVLKRIKSYFTNTIKGSKALVTAVVL